MGAGLLYTGTDWDFPTLRRSYDAIEEIAEKELGLPIPQEAIDQMKAHLTLDEEQMKLAAEELDIARRAAILREADSIVIREEPWIPVLHYSTKNLVSPKLSGFEQNLRGAIPTRFLSLKA